MKKPGPNKEQIITFQIGDLVVPNFGFLGIEEYNCLYLVVGIEDAESSEYLWWQDPKNEYIYLTVREVTSGRELTSLVVVNAGPSQCEYLIVDE